MVSEVKDKLAALRLMQDKLRCEKKNLQQAIKDGEGFETLKDLDSKITELEANLKSLLRSLS